MTDPVVPSGRAYVQVLAILIALSLVLLAAFGFIPGITTRYGDMKLAGDASSAQLLGVFQTSVLLNLIHGIVGIAGIVLARTREGARAFLLGGGILFVFLGLLGIVGGADWIPSDSADSWLHLGVGLSMIAFAIAFGRGGARRVGPVNP